jgi:exosortase B
MQIPTAYRPWVVCAIGLLALYIPIVRQLLSNSSHSDDDLRVAVLLITSLWLVLRVYPQIAKFMGTRNSRSVGWLSLSAALCAYVLGRSQDVQLLSIGSLIGVTTGLILMLNGFGALRPASFPLLFMLLMLPLPGLIVDSLTQPAADAVSRIVELLLRWCGYPIARTGVVLQLGQYQLLVAQACAGLRSLFALEAVGLLYFNLTRSRPLLTNLLLAVLIAPVAFAANVIRVLSLALITFYWGDAAGQGFFHEFSGILLFAVALLFIIGSRAFFSWTVRFRATHYT